MKKWLFILLFLPVITYGQFRMVSSTVTLISTVNDSTYIMDVDFFPDQTAKGYFASGITADYRVFSQTGQLYDITAASNLTLSSGELTIVEIDNNYVNTESAPVGQILVFDPQGDYITFTPFGNQNMGQVLQQAIGTYNSVVSDKIPTVGYPLMITDKSVVREELLLNGDTLSGVDGDTLLQSPSSKKVPSTQVLEKYAAKKTDVKYRTYPNKSILLLSAHELTNGSVYKDLSKNVEYEVWPDSVAGLPVDDDYQVEIAPGKYGVAKSNYTFSLVDENFPDSIAKEIINRTNSIKVDLVISSSSTENKYYQLPDVTGKKAEIEFSIIDQSDTYDYYIYEQSNSINIGNGRYADLVYMKNPVKIYRTGNHWNLVSGVNFNESTNIQSVKDFYKQRFYRGQKVQFNGATYTIQSSPINPITRLSYPVDSIFVFPVKDAAPWSRNRLNGNYSDGAADSILISNSYPIEGPDGGDALKITSLADLPFTTSGDTWNELPYVADVSGIVVGDTVTFSFWYMLGEGTNNNNIQIKPCARTSNRISGTCTNMAIDTTTREWRYFEIQWQIAIVAGTMTPSLTFGMDPDDVVYIANPQWELNNRATDYRRQTSSTAYEQLYAVMDISNYVLDYDKIYFPEKMQSSGDRVQTAIDFCSVNRACQEIYFATDFYIDKPILQKQTVKLRGNATSIKTSGGNILDFEGTRCFINIDDTTATAIQMYLQDATPSQQESGLVIQGIRFEVMDTIADVINVGHSIDNKLIDVSIAPTNDQYYMYKRGVVQAPEPGGGTPLRFQADNVEIEKAQEYAFYLDGNEATLNNCAIVGGGTTLNPEGPPTSRGIYVGGSRVVIRGGQLEATNSSVVYCDNCTQFRMEGVAMERNSLDTAAATAGDPSIWINGATSVIFDDLKITSIRPPAGAAIQLDNVASAVFIGGRYEAISTTFIKADCNTTSITTIGTTIGSSSNICKDVKVAEFSAGARVLESMNVYDARSYRGLHLDTTTFAQKLEFSEASIIGRRLNLFRYSSFDNALNVDDEFHYVKKDSIFSPLTGANTATYIRQRGGSGTSGWMNMVGQSDLTIGQEYNVSFYAIALSKPDNGSVKTFQLRSDVSVDDINLPSIADTTWRRYDIQWTPQGDADIDIRLQNGPDGSSFAIDGFQITPTALPTAPIYTNGAIVDDSLATVNIRDSFLLDGGKLKVSKLQPIKLLDSEGNYPQTGQMPIGNPDSTFNWSDIDAGDIDVADIAGGYASTSVEGALQELTMQTEIAPTDASTIAVTKYRCIIAIDNLEGSTQTQTINTANIPDGAEIFIKSNASVSVTFSLSSGNFVPLGSTTGQSTIAISGTGELKLLWSSDLNVFYQLL